jgi:type I restriction enzyme, S subunit
MIKSIEKLSSESLVKELLLAKKDLINSKKIMDKKDKNIYPISEIPFNIPENWQWMFLSDVSIIQEGPGIRKHQYQDEGIQFITVTNILEGTVDLLKSQKYISLKEYKEKYKHYTINKGDIVTACSGATWGKSAIYENDIPLMLNTSTLRLRFFNDLGDNRYLYYITKSNYFKSNLGLHLTGQQPNYGYSHYSKIPIPIPPLQEQQQIVAILDQAFEAIDQAKANIEKNIANAKELFQSKLNDIFSQKGDGWQEKSLGEIGKISMCKRVLKKDTTPHGEIPFYKIGTFGKKADAFIPKKVFDEFTSKYSFPKKGDILISASGTIGRRVIYDGLPAYFQDSNIVWINNNEELVTNDYLYQFYGVCDWNPSKGATISRLYNDDLRRIKISFPSISEQKQMIPKMEELKIQTNQIELHYKQKLNNLEDLKKSILQKAFAGELTNKEVEV